jgi:two-component system, chemotaxis family, chemotaxis protein CheY
MNKKILVVDDSRTARQQVRNALSSSAYELIEAVDGNDGLSKIASHLDAALIVCDVNMPHLNGLDMLRALRVAQPGAQIPIVMLTTEAQPELLQQAKQAGVRGWIVKPFKPDLFLAAVRKIVGDT